MADDVWHETTSEGLRAGLRVSALSVMWSVATGIAAIVIGIDGRSLVLSAFGGVGILDAAGSATLVVHFRHALRHDAISDDHERTALRVVTVGMVAVGVATGVGSIVRLSAHARSEPVQLGSALAGVSVPVLARLAWVKRRTARVIPSQALHADGWLSAAGAALASITVAGTVLASGLGLWWVDPVAALGVAVGAVGLSIGLRPRQ